MTTTYTGADLYATDEALEMRPGLADDIIEATGSVVAWGLLMFVAAFGPDGIEIDATHDHYSRWPDEDIPAAAALLQEHGYLAIEGDPPKYRITGLTWATESAATLPEEVIHEGNKKAWAKRQARIAR